MVWVKLLALVMLGGAAVQDWNTRTIANGWCAAIFASALVQGAITNQPLAPWLGLVGVGAPLLLFAVLAGDGVGGGDVKLTAAVSAVVGIYDGYGVLLFALLILVFSLLLRGKRHGAFAPCLFCAYFLSLLPLLGQESQIF